MEEYPPNQNSIEILKESWVLSQGTTQTILASKEAHPFIANTGNPP